MTTYLVRTAETNPAGRPSADAAPRTAGSRTAPKKNLSVLTAGILVALTCSILLSLNAIGVTGPTAPSVQLASTVTNVEEHGDPHARALSGPTIPLEVSTASQRNAVRSAKGYLDYSAFSRQGLIEQLEYEGFSTADATLAVDSIATDWNVQAAKAAKAYLDYSGFSRSGLIDQLEYEGYTPAQAAYGATAAGL
ncbi:Ltp family lipoprotein [Mycolicibacterium fortuitum]|uniref:Ltp family lipoprotein n=2 Tax=Mycolicibacterium fortuitum TaxID=1766 RepID=A0AAE5AGE4_MYCFO|nr:Ltp family lipoprotein [Mycolicibacterium fortuitum]MCV7142839.1 Ltp family lipoprotein [Mycolicibacterium fortuitum]MDV7195271.1 Ltp family lipoprotein [Mycolicibacterium fortuitum]MDV7208956.1 Ltp family lipoprotein [Mycolicibacterium fortuitum]MDV7230837.1 Ltp family lipoprotein [Mycolicibacterium fortuitum]MDV7262365.1 Ltp family lipoprotein [Mycolicibacterium fortuitum]